MGTPKEITFSYKELVELMVKAQGIHDGIWGLYVRFGIQGANIGQGPSDVRPAAIIPVLEIGIHAYEEENALTVDAAVANPKKAKEGKKKAGKVKRKKN